MDLERRPCDDWVEVVGRATALLHRQYPLSGWPIAENTAPRRTFIPGARFAQPIWLLSKLRQDRLFRHRMPATLGQIPVARDLFRPWRVAQRLCLSSIL